MRPIDGTTYICGLIGNPVAHTKSPAIHNFLAEKTGFNLAYGAFPVATGKLPEAIPGAYALGIKGLNVLNYKCIHCGIHIPKVNVSSESLTVCSQSKQTHQRN